MLYKGVKLMSDFEITKLVSHKIQLKEVYLKKLDTIRNHSVSIHENKDKIKIEISNTAEILDDSMSEAILGLRVFFVDVDPQPFSINIVYGGLCGTNESVSKEELKMFAELQSVPLLWPYIRQALSDIMSKMSITPILLPTMDVVKTLYNVYKKDDEGKI